MNPTELKEAIEAIKENHLILGDYIGSVIKNKTFGNIDTLAIVLLRYFKKYENSQTEFSNVYKIAEHLELHELTAKMEAIEKQETDEFFEEEKMKKDYLK